MRSRSMFLSLLFTSVVLTSCEFHCSVGDKGETKDANPPVVKDGASIYNGIEVKSNGVKVNKAYLIYEDGTRVKDDNFVDFKQPVKVAIFVDEGWTEKDGKVFLGASEKVTTDDGKVVLDEADIFANDTVGATPSDAKIITITFSLKLEKEIQPTKFNVNFKVWDKNGEGYVEGQYKLSSK